jgi:hypothetical protein
LINYRIAEISNGAIFELLPSRFNKLNITQRVLGEGSYYDTDGVPVVLTLLQNGGLLWRLDVSRADGKPLKAPLNYDSVLVEVFLWQRKMQRTFRPHDEDRVTVPDHNREKS